MSRSLSAFHLAAAFFGATSAFSQTIIQHSGANNPLTEGFSISSLHNPEVQQLGPVFDDQGFDAWSIKDSRPSGYTFYQYALLPEETESASIHGWMMSANMRFVELGDSRLDLMTASNGFTFYLTLKSNGDIVVSHRQVVLYTIEGGGNDYHEFSLVYDVEDTTVSLWIDGSLRLTNIFESTNYSAPTSVLFGNGGPHGHTHWNEFTFAAIPEPATVALLSGLGALVFVGALRWRERKQERRRSR